MDQESREVSVPAGWLSRPPAADGALADLAARSPLSLPSSYLAFLRRSDGGEGVVGDLYLRLWPAANVLGWNRSHGLPVSAGGARHRHRRGLASLSP